MDIACDMTWPDSLFVENIQLAGKEAHLEPLLDVHELPVRIHEQIHQSGVRELVGDATCCGTTPALKQHLRCSQRPLQERARGGVQDGLHTLRLREACHLQDAYRAVPCRRGPCCLNRKASLSPGQKGKWGCTPLHTTSANYIDTVCLTDTCEAVKTRSYDNNNVWDRRLESSSCIAVIEVLLDDAGRSCSH